MVRNNADGSKSIHTAFIPTSFAQIGRHIELIVGEDEDGEGKWSEGWVVSERGATRDQEVLELQRKAQRAFATKLDSKKRR